ncbi:gluconate 2-dehydrogenase subunit 3 family protein [Knoellia sp. Soil729]|uniref:gluconate 2-dehydrogenase subunit 3 family protein n=1 Tax=Knoellia sp. Soil729 TaxID=1736394 RepID=UPI0006F296F8|nr:gluconate 2-dehydrogenase subunit 3 family protein [Knoellia sp. Soil729]KRE41572.1 hypothetical protein ASG74_13710 [Knoellia sp. Soil729]
MRLPRRGAEPGAPPAGQPWSGRFPGFDVLDQSSHWDPATTGVVLARVGMAPDIRFFTPDEEAVATALCDQLLAQDDATEPQARVAVVNMIDARLAERQTDGWRYDDMPDDGQAWRESLAWLDADANEQFGCDFAACSRAQQGSLIHSVQNRGSDTWHGLCAERVWSLWTRYACTAFYSHPFAWNEMGFSGPAYPRGYKNAGIDRLEPFEVRDARPGDDPLRRRA